jgi:hypothetical protein
VRWISTIALQANLQSKDGIGEGANDSEGAHMPGRGARTLGEGARTPEEGARTLVEGGA